MPNEPLRMQLDCPLPTLDFEQITLGHGSGGLLTHRLLDGGVFSLLKNEHLDKQGDAATLTLTGRTAFTTDSFVVSPIFFPGGSIGELAVNGTVNDLAMAGARPVALSLALILEEGLSTEDLWRVLVGVKAACETAGVEVITGDTKVVERGKGDQVFINTTGLGTVHPDADLSASRVVPGTKLVVSGQIAQHGIAILSLREGLEFETTVESDTVNLNHTVWSLLDQFGGDIRFLRDATRGGLGTVLVELAQQSGAGVSLKQAALPVDGQVEAACEMLGLDPLYVANEGVFVAAVAPEVADDFVAALRSDPNGRHAAVIGEVVEAHPRQVVLQSRIGGRRVVTMLPGEQLPRIC
ncbi:MAG: hydrogenase expression/formation protein HypE [Bacteroidota bacterium]